MVPKPSDGLPILNPSFRAVLFRMVPKPGSLFNGTYFGFRAVLFRMVPKLSMVLLVQ